MKLLRVHCSLDGNGMLRKLIKRVEEFCRKYESDADLNVLFESVTEAYFSPSPSMLLFVTVDDNDKVIAHTMFSIEHYFGSHTINMFQYWKDPEVKIPYSMKADVYKDVVAWGKAMGIDKMRIWARNENVARLAEAVYGFKRSERIVMYASIEEVANRLAELPDNEEKEAEWVEAVEKTVQQAV